VLSALLSQADSSRVCRQMGPTPCNFFQVGTVGGPGGGAVALLRHVRFVEAVRAAAGCMSCC
jgi:hypothetical protein